MLPEVAGHKLRVGGYGGGVVPPVTAVPRCRSAKWGDSFGDDDDDHHHHHHYTLLETEFVGGD